jgi:hypothetical protein
MWHILMDMIPRGSTVYTLKVDKKVDNYMLFCIHQGKIHNITNEALVVCGRKPGSRFYVKGTGMNHGLEAVQTISMALYEDVNSLIHGKL